MSGQTVFEAILDIIHPVCDGKIFGVFGDGTYRLRPLHVEDMALLLVEHANMSGDITVDAVGPEGFSYIQLVRTLAEILQVRRPIMRIPSPIAFACSKLLNPFVKDVIITKEEVKGLMRGLLDSQYPSTGTIKLTQWAKEHRDTLGYRYASEVGRRVNRTLAYDQI